MIKHAYQMGIRAALIDAGFLTKEAEGKAGLLRRAWQAATKTPARKALTAAGGLGLGGLGTAMALRQPEETGTLEQVGDFARSLMTPENMIPSRT